MVIFHSYVNVYQRVQFGHNILHHQPPEEKVFHQRKWVQKKLTIEFRGRTARVWL
jgi:hypothetical protein